MKKLVCMLLAVAVVLGFFTAPAFAKVSFSINLNPGFICPQPMPRPVVVVPPCYYPAQPIVGHYYYPGYYYEHRVYIPQYHRQVMVPQPGPFYTPYYPY